MHNRKLGRKNRAHGNLPHMSQMRRAVRPPPVPTSIEWLRGMPLDLGMMMNDKLGCCAIAGLHHARQVWSLEAGGVEITDPDTDVLADYEALAGYNPADPDTDQGAVLQDVLAGCVSRGITTVRGPDKLLGYIEIDPRLQQDVREVIALSGVAYLGINIPEAWTEMEGGGKWDDASGPVAGGHCIIAVGYDADGFDIVSWGMRFRLTNAGFGKSCNEAYALIDRNWVEKTGLTPGGISIDDLETAMRSMRE